MVQLNLDNKNDRIAATRQALHDIVFIFGIFFLWYKYEYDILARSLFIMDRLAENLLNIFVMLTEENVEHKSLFVWGNYWGAFKLHLSSLPEGGNWKEKTVSFWDYD